MKNNPSENQSVLKNVQNFLGANNLFLLQELVNKKVSVFSTGSYNLNLALGTNGWPVGRIVEIYGAESSGKSTLCLHAIAECQKKQGNAVYIDVENTLDIEWAKKIGIDVNNLLVSRPESGEQTFTIINALVKTNMVDLIIVDSVAAMTPKAELNAQIDDQLMGIHARLMSKGLRLLQSALIGSKTTVIFINQVREKIGISYGPSTVTTGGRALRYAASMRVEVKRTEAIKDGTAITGYNVKATVTKNKLATPMKSAILNLYFNLGFDYIAEIIDNAINTNLILKKGSWYSYDNKNLAQGFKGLRQKLVENLELYKIIENQVLNPESKTPKLESNAEKTLELNSENILENKTEKTLKAEATTNLKKAELKTKGSKQ